MLSRHSAKNAPLRRKLSFSERGHLAFSLVLPVYFNQIVIEGDSDSNVDLEELESAIRISSESNPGSRLVLRGVLNSCYLEDSGVPPPLRVIENISWDGLSSDNADFLDNQFSAKDGPTCEVVFLKGSPNRIIFRSHHMVMDGVGTRFWAEDVFRILRGEKPVSFFSELTEYDLVRRLKKRSRLRFPQDNIAPTGKANGITSFKARWIRKSITGKFSDLTGQTATLLAAEARTYSEGNFWLSIPVDLRYRENNFRSTRNFAGILYVEVKPEYSPADISKAIKHQLKNSEDLRFDVEDIYCRYVPISIIKRVVTNRILKRHLKGQYGSSAIISNLGLMDCEKLSGGGFYPKTAFFIPPGGYSPAFVTLTGSKDTVEILSAVPDVLASNNRDEKLMDTIVNGLVSN